MRALRTRLLSHRLGMALSSNARCSPGTHPQEDRRARDKLAVREGRTGYASYVNGTLNLGPGLGEVTAAPVIVCVGGKVLLDGGARDPDQGPAALSYSWLSFRVQSLVR
jgi:hypothetical protein